MIKTALPAAFLALTLAHPAAAHGRGPSDIGPPVGAHPGQCFAKVREPDAVEHTREQVLVKPAGAYDRIIPAVTRTVDKTVVVQPASEEVRTHPAVFNTIWKTVVEPGAAREIDVPARYRIVTERVLISPARTVWKHGAGRPVTGEPSYGQTAYEATGEVMCRVLIPARYAVTRHVVLVSPASHRTVEGRPIAHRVSERVQVSPERVERIAHAVVTKTVQETVVVTPARTVTVRTPPVWRVIERTKTTQHYGWQPIVCAHPAPAPHYAPHAYRAPQRMEQPYSLPPTRTPYGERG